MNIKYYRFFGGALKSQENWLNKIAAKGYRLVRTDKLLYEFEECPKQQYQYKLEFVGHKSKNNSEDYKNFLEDCGYRVFYKNINLNYNVGKAEWRPWAEKGGRISTGSGTFNKELLIVEKVNDGKPFELHTSEEDIKEYRRNIRKPWLFFLAFALVIAAISISAGSFSFNSGLRIGYIGNENRSSWSAKYALLDGYMRKNIRVSQNKLDISVETLSGSFSLEIQDADGNIIFSEDNIPTKNFSVETQNKATVKIQCDNHSGSFNIKG